MFLDICSLKSKQWLFLAGQCIQMNKQAGWTFLKGCLSTRPLFVFFMFFFQFFRLIVYCFCLFRMCSFVKQNRDVLSRSSSVSSVHSLWVLLSLIILQYCPPRIPHLTPLLCFPLPTHSFPVVVPIQSIQTVFCTVFLIPIREFATHNARLVVAAYNMWCWNQGFRMTGAKYRGWLFHLNLLDTWAVILMVQGSVHLAKGQSCLVYLKMMVWNLTIFHLICTICVIFERAKSPWLS